MSLSSSSSSSSSLSCLESQNRLFSRFTLRLTRDLWYEIVRLVYTNSITCDFFPRITKISEQARLQGRRYISAGGNVGYIYSTKTIMSYTMFSFAGGILFGTRSICALFIWVARTRTHVLSWDSRLDCCCQHTTDWFVAKEKYCS